MSKRRRRRQRMPEELFQVEIESLSPEGRGVAHMDGKVVFIDFALSGEIVEFKYSSMSKKFDEGRAVNIIKASADRVEPICEHFTVCGGCSMQHLEHEAQISSKQDALMLQFDHLGKAQPNTILPPLRGPEKHYRQKARLSVKYVFKKEKVLVGFREKGSSFIADLHSCPILHESVGNRLTALSEMIIQLDARATIPQIEVAIDDTKTALVFRHLEPLSEKDREIIKSFAQQEDLHILLQSAGPDSVSPLWPEETQVLKYTLQEQNINIEFSANDFTQVNSEINQAMVTNTIKLLDLNATDKVLDLFCGLGNFTLAMARQCAEITGVEGTLSMVEKARQNAQRNNINNATFFAADLSKELQHEPWITQSYDKILLDPPRSGAMEMLKYISKLGAKRIVYVSCNPATLARDTYALVHEHGYVLEKAGVMDMFPHTAHVESIALFIKK